MALHMSPVKYGGVSDAFRTVPSTVVGIVHHTSYCYRELWLVSSFQELQWIDHAIHGGVMV